MRKIEDIAGLKPRIEAAFHLKGVLTGKPFHPIGVETLAEPRDRALANRLVTLALRRHGQISHVLGAVLPRGLPPRSGIVEAVLRLGIVQLLYADDLPAHAALDLSVEAVRRDRRAGRFDKLVNATLRTVQRDTAMWQGLGGQLLFPDWLAERWRSSFGEAAIAKFAEALLAGAPLDLTFKAQDADLAAALCANHLLGETYRVVTREAVVADLPGFAEGRWWVQDAAAALPARLIPSRTGQTVLDLCAAPGGKTAQLAARGAKVTALDISADRMGRVVANLARLGLAAATVIGDALDFDRGPIFDAVLLDAPCSATGTFRRHPEVVWQRDVKGIAGRVELQRKMLAHGVQLVRPGGILVYCVCSLETEEGEGQLDWVRANLPELSILPVVPEELDGWPDPILANGALRTTPAQAVPGSAGGALDGFFAVRFAKAEG